MLGQGKTMTTYNIKATPKLIKNLEGLIDFHTMHRNAPLAQHDIELIKAALVIIKLDAKSPP